MALGVSLDGCLAACEFLGLIYWYGPYGIVLNVPIGRAEFCTAC